MTFFRLILASLRHHWRMNLAVACGTAVGTAVLTGALLVGDSMRGSLRTLLLDRLGRINYALVPGRFFRTDLFDVTTADAAPAVLLQASLANPETDPPRRANGVNLIGCDDSFWKLGGVPKGVLKGDITDLLISDVPFSRGIVLNRPLAERLGVRPGDAVMLRLPRPGAIPAESALGERRDTIRSYRLTVKEITPARGLGAFSLQPNQQTPLNAYVPREWLSARLDQPGRANVLLSGADGLPPLHPQLADYDLLCERSPQGYIQITSSRMIVPRQEEEAILAAVAQVPPLPKGEGIRIQPTFTYLANTLADGGWAIPYSTITAIDFSSEPPLGPFLDSSGKPVPPLKDGEIALNSWAAEDLHARIGDTIKVTYFEPESLHGEVRKTTREFRLAAVVQLAGAAADRRLTPEVKGVTDEKTLADWKPPFPFEPSRIRPKDETYWKQHGATPKAFVSLATGRRLWGSRFGQTTALRFALPVNKKISVQDFGKILNERLSPRAFGFVWQPVRQQGLRAAEGTTPFQWLFLGFSFFLIIAALMLVLLLFRLGVEQRAAEFGLLLAVGWTPRQVRRLLLIEALFIAGFGSLLGVLGGVGYAALMLRGLQTWWLPAISAPFLSLHLAPASLAIGFFAGLLAAFAALYRTARRIARVPPRQLLIGGRTFLSGMPKTGKNACPPWLEILWLCLLLAHLPAWWLLRGQSGLQAGAFFGSGMLVLVLTLLVIQRRLRRSAAAAAVKAGRGNLLRLALRNAARTPGRSTLSIGLTAAACFLIVSVSVFRIDPRQQDISISSGNGGFALVAESDQPLYQDLNTREGRSALGFNAAEEKLLRQCRFYALRVQPGEQASCLNLYQPARPRMLGIPPALRQRGGFAWADAPKECDNPWQLLSVGRVSNPSHYRQVANLSHNQHPVGRDSISSHNHQPVGRDSISSHDPLPLILEKNTANYALHLWSGLGESWQMLDPRRGEIEFQVAALLDNSLFQGDLLVAEENLLKIFPDAGCRFFLIETPVGRVSNSSHDNLSYSPDDVRRVQEILENRLGDFGFTVEPTGRRLARFLAVQNTYLSAFQSLGGLGLLLGVLGLAVVELRNVVERRGELALLRAAGFRRRTLAALVLGENAVLLALGLGAGLLAALLAVLPQLGNRQVMIPWATLAVTLLLILLGGLLAAALAIRRAVRTPLLATLRKEI